MAEIKSSLELAMERSKRFAISDQERDEIKRREVEQKAASLFHRYIDGHLALHEVLKEIERADEKTRPVMKEILLSQWIDALSLQEEDERLLKGIESLKERSLDEIREKLHRLSRSYSEESEEARQEVREEMAEALKKREIYGSALEPNMTGSEALKSLFERMDRVYRDRIREVKEALRKL